MVIIPKSVAESIGYFMYSGHEAIDLRCNEQKDGSYVINDELYGFIKTRLKDRVELKSVVSSKFTATTKEQMESNIKDELTKTKP